MSQQKPIARAITSEAAAPIYLTYEDDFTGPQGRQLRFGFDPRFTLRPDFVEAMKGIPAVRGRWKCPYCQMIFHRRKPCEMHMGLIKDSPAQCPVLKAQDEERRKSLIDPDASVWFHGREYHRLFTLTDQQWAYAMIEAELCNKKAMGHGYIPAHGCTMEDAPKMHRIGAPGEVGFCECFVGMSWKSNEGSYRKPDSLNRFGVRTASKSNYRLWVFKEDGDDWVMVLIVPTGEYRQYRIVGWLFAKEAKVLRPDGKPKYWDEGQQNRPAYYVPQKDLHDWKLLPEMIERAKVV